MPQPGYPVGEEPAPVPEEGYPVGGEQGEGGYGDEGSAYGYDGEDPPEGGEEYGFDGQE